MVGQKIQHPPTSVADKAAFYWNPHGGPKFYEHLVYGAGKPRCVVPLEAFKKACKEDESFGLKLRQEYTDMARSGTADELTNLAFFYLIIDNDLENGGDLLKDAAKRHPSAQTLCQYARFLYNVKKEYTAAWQLFEKALVADSTHVDTIGYYAGFVASVQRDYDHAERLFLRCLELAPFHPNHLGGYARFLATVRGRHQDAETYFERSIGADPCNVVNLNNYAAFLAEIRKDYALAEEYFRKAVDMDPSCGFAVRNLLNFLVWMRGDEAAAKELWHRGGEAALRSSLDETYHPENLPRGEAGYGRGGQVHAARHRNACIQGRAARRRGWQVQRVRLVRAGRGVLRDQPSVWFALRGPSVQLQGCQVVHSACCNTTGTTRKAGSSPSRDAQPAVQNSAWRTCKQPPATGNRAWLPTRDAMRWHWIVWTWI